MNTMHSVSNTSLMRSSEAVAVRNSFSFRSLMMMMMMVMMIVNVVIGETVTINVTTSGVTGTYQSTTFIQDGFTFGYTQWMKSTNIQAKKSTTNSLYNVTAFPGKILSITFKQTGDARAITVYGGTSSQPTNQITSPATAATMTFDFSGYNYTYFSMNTPGNACYFDEIVITYESATHNVTWSVDGTTTDISTNSLTNLNIPADPSIDCSGKVFVGWTTTEIDGVQNTAPTYLYSRSSLIGTNVTEDKTYYAVFANISGTLNEYSLYSGAITEGNYIIYYDGKAMNTTVSSSRLRYESVTPSSNKITTTNTAIIWHIAPSGNYWTIYNESENKYAASTGTKNEAQMLGSGTDDKSLWTITGTSTYEFVNKKNTANNVNANLRNNGSYGFACYGTGTGGALSLYKSNFICSGYVTSCSTLSSLTVIYDGNGETSGSVPTDNNEYAYNASVTVLGNTGSLAKTGCRFAGWCTNAAGTGTTYTAGNTFTITANTTLYAKWINQYSVTYNANGADGGSVPTDATIYDSGTSVIVLDNTGSLTKAGCRFAGWCTNAAGTGTTYTAGNTFAITANTTLYAKWINQYGVTYDANGADSGSAPTDNNLYDSGTNVNIPNNTNLAKDGFVFAGWNTRADGSGTTYLAGDSFIITSNTILYAKWADIRKVIWSIDGAETEQEYPIDLSYELIIPSSVSSILEDYDCNGKVFVGWTTHSDYYSHSEAPDDLTQTPSITVTTNTTYYAVFAIRDITGYEETLSQTLQYDSWSYSGSTTDKSTYRMFHTGSYIQSAEFDLSTLTKVIVYGGTFGGSQYNSLTIGDGTNTWKDVTVSGKSETGENIYTDGTALPGTGSLRIISNSGTATGTVSGVRISQVKIYVMAPVYAYSNYTTDCSHSDYYSVFYDANGATGDVPIDGHGYDTGDNAIILGIGNLNVEGFHFYSWNTSADGSGTDYQEGDEIEITVANVRLYAIWKASIVWLANGLAVVNSKYNYGTNIGEEVPTDVVAEEHKCPGKHFIGWSEFPFEDTDDRPAIITRKQIVGLAVTGDKKYYAVYAETNQDDVPMNTILWTETWSGGTAEESPSDYEFEGTFVYGDAILTYTETSSGGTVTKLKEENLAQGASPELLLSKNGGTWTISGIPTGGAYQMSFTFKSNHESFILTGEPASIDVSGTGKNWTITNPDNVETFNLTLTNNNGSETNARIDDIELKVIQISAGATAYTTFCPCVFEIDEIEGDNNFIWAGKNAEAPLNDWSSTDNWTVYRTSDSKYHLATESPSTENNVFIVQKADCGITAIPDISENTTCNNLTMFNGLGIDIAENQTLTINGTATFTNGVINGNVIFGPSATVSGASASSHVDGVVTKSGTANDFTFPTGSNGNLGKVVVTDGTATNVSVQYFCNPAGFGTNDLPRWWNAADMSGENPFNHVSNVEYWKISSNEAITANFVAEASTDMHFNSETAEEDRIPANIQMAFYDNNRWTNVGGSASIDGNTLSINGAEIPASATRGISGNYTTFGSKSKSTVLPIELVSFTANCNGRSALIEWTTATEKNNDYFVLERSHDAVNFKEIARVAGAGNSIEPINYAYTDFGVRNGDNYYRLVQFDYDGTSTTSEIIVANCLGTDGEPEVLAYPNPFGDDLTLRFENFGNIQATVEVYDMLGRMVHTQKINCSQNDYEVVLRLAGLSDGTYNVRISAKEFVLNKKVVKQ